MMVPHLCMPRLSPAAHARSHAATACHWATHPGSRRTTIKVQSKLNEAAALLAKAAAEQAQGKGGLNEAELKRIAASTQATAAKVESIEKKLDQALRIQRLQWAITNAETTVHERNTSDRSRKTTEVVEVLQSFMIDCGHWIPDDAGQEFRDQLSRQIHMLTGTKPRIVKQKTSDGTMEYCIDEK